MARRTGLGRGLDALIPSSGPGTETSVLLLPADHIRPNPRQPRVVFDEVELNELAESIRLHGILQPLIVSPGDGPDDYVLVAGERRLQAARRAGLEAVPAIVRPVGDQQRLELALIENVQRTDLGALEAAEAYRQLAEDFNLSHEDIAARVGKSRAAVTNTLRLLKLPAGVRQALAEGKVSEGHARALLALPTTQAQSAALQTILAQNLSVRQAEELVRKLCGQKPPSTRRPAQPPEIVELEERLRSALRTKVTLNRRRKGGTVVIHFYSDEDLSALVEHILRE